MSIPHEMAKAAADATVPEDSEGYSREKWFIARDAVLFAAEALTPTPTAEKADAELVAKAVVAGNAVLNGQGSGLYAEAEEAIHLLLAALQSRPAEPAGEEPGHQIYSYGWGEGPVAWLYRGPDGETQIDLEKGPFAGEWTETPLYARPATPSNPDRLVEAVRTTIARCEALEDEASNELVKADSEHAQGYWRGQKRTAKSIRRELHDLTRAALSAPALNGEKGE